MAKLQHIFGEVGMNVPPDIKDKGPKILDALMKNITSKCHVE